MMIWRVGFKAVALLCARGSLNGNVPAGTRSIRVQLSMQRSVGGFNDGYADNLSLVLGLNGGTLFLPLVVR